MNAKYVGPIPKAKDFRHAAWQSLKGKWFVCVIAYLILQAIMGGLEGLSSIGIGAVALLIVAGPLMLGWYKIALKVARGEDVEIVMLFNGFSDFARSLVLYITNYLLIFLWSLLFIIPGIVKQYSYAMSYYILLDNPDMSANDARKKSMEMMHGNKWRLFCLDLSFIGWALLCVITFGILLFWVAPYMEVSKAKFYLSLLPEEERVDSAVDGGDTVDLSGMNIDIDASEPFGDEFVKNDSGNSDFGKNDFDFSKNDNDEFNF